MNELVNYIFSVGFANSIVRMSTPLIFVSMAAVLGAKANILCIAYEGMMLFAALGGVIGSAVFQSLLLGMLCGILAGSIIAGLFAYFVLVLKTKDMLVGLALNTLGSGGTIFTLYMLSGQKGSSISMSSLQFPSVTVPVIKDIPVLGEIFSGHNLLTYLAYLSVALVYIFLYKTPLGLRIRSVGENPDAAESVGTDIVKVKVIALMVGGVLASFGGMFMSMGYTPYFTRDMMNGRGFNAIAAQNLGVGHPLLTMVCAMVFGMADAFGIALQTYRIPSQVASMVPYITTLLGLIIIGQAQKKKEKKHALMLGAREWETETAPLEERKN
ncbi:MAG: ABC transporter permease [Lachnospiraceae bacterium]|jgi:ABC-type uncharacterized transport system permease subunit|nr:ABC transporter permease [Lachnospiraceae bacterium]